MLAALRQMLGSCGDGKESDRHVLERAAALLMLEVAHADTDYAAAERSAILEGIRESTSLTPAECETLLQKAEAEIADLTSLHAITRVMVDSTTVAERQQLLGALWRIAYTDGQVDKHEEHIIRRIADLLYVPHSGYIQAKLAAQK